MYLAKVYLNFWLQLYIFISSLHFYYIIIYKNAFLRVQKFVISTLKFQTWFSFTKKSINASTFSMYYNPQNNSHFLLLQDYFPAVANSNLDPTSVYMKRSNSAQRKRTPLWAHWFWASEHQLSMTDFHIWNRIKPGLLVLIYQVAVFVYFDRKNSLTHTPPLTSGGPYRGPGTSSVLVCSFELPVVDCPVERLAFIVMNLTLEATLQSGH